MHVFDLYMPKRRYGIYFDGSYQLSDVDDEMSDKERGKDYDDEMFISEEWDNT